MREKLRFDAREIISFVRLKRRLIEENGALTTAVLERGTFCSASTKLHLGLRVMCESPLRPRFDHFFAGGLDWLRQCLRQWRHQYRLDHYRFDQLCAALQRFEWNRRDRSGHHRDFLAKRRLIHHTIGFCDDQTSLFPLDQTVRVNFNPGQPCATVIVVVIIV